MLTWDVFFILKCKQTFMHWKNVRTLLKEFICKANLENWAEIHVYNPKQILTFTRSKQHCIMCFYDLTHCQIINYNWCKMHVNCVLSDCRKFGRFLLNLYSRYSQIYTSSFVCSLIKKLANLIMLSAASKNVVPAALFKSIFKSIYHIFPLV